MSRRPLPGFEGHYDVSDEGEVRRIVKGLGGKLGPLRPFVLQRGYPCVYPYKNARHHPFMVHTAVAAAFLGPRPDGHQINHKNGIKTDNRAANLEYVTRKQNAEHAVRLGLTACGARIPQSKLTEQQVREIRRRSTAGESFAALGRAFAVSSDNVALVVKRKSWRHVI